MTSFTSGNVPGFQAKNESQESEVTWSSRQGVDLVATRGVVIDATSVDAGNVPTTTLRGGLVMAIASGSGHAIPYDPDGNNGSQIAVGVLEDSVKMEIDGVATQRFTQLIVQGMVSESQLTGLDERARLQLAGKLQFDNVATKPGVMMHPRGVYRMSGSKTLQASESGLLFLATAAATFTLPTAANGLAYRIAQTADADLVISGSSNLIHKGSNSASSVAFSTTSQKIGSQVLVECVYTNTDTLKWLVTNLGGTPVTM